MDSNASEKIKRTFIVLSIASGGWFFIIRYRGARRCWNNGIDGLIFVGCVIFDTVRILVQ